MKTEKGWFKTTLNQPFLFQTGMQFSKLTFPSVQPDRKNPLPHC